MLKTESRKIGELDVSVTQFAGRRNLSILIDLSKVVGPTIAAALGGDGKAANILDANIDIGGIADTLFSSMDKKVTIDLIRDLTSATHINDRALDDKEFDRVFAGQDLWLLPKVLAFVVEVNFGNFSELAGAVSTVGSQAAEKASES